MRTAGMRHGVKDWTGKRVGAITVLSYSGIHNKNSHWLCRCDCGTQITVGAPNLKQQMTKSCGCKKSALVASARTTHGGAPRGRHDPAYNCWRRMKSRCYYERDIRFPSYGARGITVCDRWLHGEGGQKGFACFLADVGPRPSPAHTIDRKDNDGNYEPGNCRWATPKEQARNKRPRRIAA